MILSRILVDHTDPRLLVPAKFVGSLYDGSAAHALAKERDWTVAADGSAWRRVVPSLRPLRVL
ncbi:hypothetical protein AS189_12945 [Arthrobacter alpinus]|uniref:Uncharacterized protein n=1 Tax=Arthrobacter alpinus TaxID=656366 RepID=A0A0S2M092_9MICC|nr:hypothetical protein AS189_12945 [Arthrobacter alpinus]